VFQLVHNTVAQQERSKVTKLVTVGKRATDLTHRIPATAEKDITILINQHDDGTIHWFFILVYFSAMNEHLMMKSLQ
jgi:hypothetical protein